MAVLLQPFAALTVWPETLLYHTTLLMLATFGAVAVTSQQRLMPMPTGRRLTWVLGVIALLYLVSLGLELLRGWGGLDLTLIAPVWERALAALGLVGLVWALALPPKAWATAVSGVLVGGLVIGTAVSFWVWQAALAQGGPVFYNGLPADGLWALAQSALAALGVCLVLVRRPTQWVLTLSVFAVLWVGQTMHYLFPPAALHFPLMVRLTELLALGLLAVLVTRKAAQVPPLEVIERPLPMLAPPEDSLSPTAEPIHPRLHRLANALTRTQAQKAQVEEQLYSKQVIIAQLKAELVHATAELERLQNMPAPTPEPPLPAHAPAVVAMQDELQALRQQLASVPPLAPAHPLKVRPRVQPPDISVAPTLTVCVHLGLAQDPQTRNAFAAAVHRCYALAEPGKIFSLHQEQFCLQPAHTLCPVFQKRVTQLTEPIDFTSASPRRTLPPDTLSRLRAWAERKGEN